MALEGLLEILGQTKSGLEVLGLTFLAGGLVGYGLRSMISRRRHRRARALRKMQHRSSHQEEIWALPPHVKETASPSGVIPAHAEEQSPGLAPERNSP
jgi:hypothetical protein